MLDVSCSAGGMFWKCLASKSSRSFSAEDRAAWKAALALSNVGFRFRVKGSCSLGSMPGRLAV